MIATTNPLPSLIQSEDFEAPCPVLVANVYDAADVDAVRRAMRAIILRKTFRMPLMISGRTRVQAPLPNLHEDVVERIVSYAEDALLVRTKGRPIALECIPEHAIPYLHVRTHSLNIDMQQLAHRMCLLLCNRTALPMEVLVASNGVYAPLEDADPDVRMGHYLAAMELAKKYRHSSVTVRYCEPIPPDADGDQRLPPGSQAFLSTPRPQRTPR